MALVIDEFDWRSPLETFAAFSGEADAHILHSPSVSSSGRWSIIVARPKSTFWIKNEVAFIDGAPTNRAPLDSFRSYVADWSEWDEAEPLVELPFAGGFVGFVSYEAGALFETAIKRVSGPSLMPDIAFGYYASALCFDHADRRVYLVAECAAESDHLKDAIESSIQNGKGRHSQVKHVLPEHDVSTYCRMLEDVKERILDGEIYQANISQRIEIEFDEVISHNALFQRLGTEGAPFMGLLQYSSGAIVSNSPERFFQIMPEGGERRIIVSPVKGTRPRGATAQSDAALKLELVGDEKDRAENIMIADLMRNDLSRICDDGSVKEDGICVLESFPRVHHLVSHISGRLGEKVGAVDILQALFPSGSITGAPKIQAMEVIRQVENAPRGPYCGALGYFSKNGAADFSVLIRTMTIESAAPTNRLEVPVGGGITLLSDSKSEYREIIHKAASVVPFAAAEIESLL